MSRLGKAVLWAAVIGSTFGAGTETGRRAVCAAEKPKNPENRWEAQIQAFEAQDRKQAPPRQGVVFIGSSSIRLWDLGKSFPDLPAINRGFGGSQLADAARYVDRIVAPYAPRVVVLYAGDNDIAAGKSPEQVAADYRAFVQRVHAALPAARIVYLAIKPSLARWKLVDKMRRANGLIRAAAREDRRLVFVDVDPPMLDANGKPRPELFKPDGLHLNDEGYKLWAELLRPHLAPE